MAISLRLYDPCRQTFSGLPLLDYNVVHLFPALVLECALVRVVKTPTTKSFHHRRQLTEILSAFRFYALRTYTKKQANEKRPVTRRREQASDHELLSAERALFASWARHS